MQEVEESLNKLSKDDDEAKSFPEANGSKVDDGLTEINGLTGKSDPKLSSEEVNLLLRNGEKEKESKNQQNAG